MNLQTELVRLYDEYRNEAYPFKEEINLGGFMSYLRSKEVDVVEECTCRSYDKSGYDEHGGYCSVHLPQQNLDEVIFKIEDYIGGNIEGEEIIDRMGLTVFLRNILTEIARKK